MPQIFDTICDSQEGVEEAIMQSICFGGDTDTITCMAGAIVGAHWGSALIPERWLELCEGTDAARAAADTLYEGYRARARARARAV